MTNLRLLSEGKTWVYRNKVLVTDPARSPRQDAVLHLCHENRFLVEHLSVPKDGTVLDLCTGSGVLAIFAAERARSVVGVDINPRAIEFARLNAELNNLHHKIEWKLGDLFEPVKGRRFDAILANPPFEPTNPGSSNYLHSDGGDDGLYLVRKIIEGAGEHLNPNGSIQMMVWLSSRSLSLIDRLGKLFEGKCVMSTTLLEFSMGDYVHHLEQLPLSGGAQRFLPSAKAGELFHYLYIHVLPLEAPIHSTKEAYRLDKAIPAPGSFL